MTIHLIKLCVGAETLEDLEAWQTRQMKTLPNPVHHTRMSPKRAEEVLAGGSIYWVIRNRICVRQRIVDIRTGPDETGRSMCELVFDPELIPVTPRPKKPFQGWRYFKTGDAPPDLNPGAKASDLPVALDTALKDAMVW
jgi:hypothetical protein